MSRTLVWLVASLALAAGLTLTARPSATQAQVEGARVEGARVEDAKVDDAPIPLHVAVERGLVDVQVAGRGASTGDSVEVRVRRKDDAKLTISVEPGTVIQPTGSNVQTMTLAGVKYKHSRRGFEPAAQIELNDDSRQTYILEGYCRDFEKPTPTRHNQFSVQGPDADNAQVLVRAKQLGATVKVTQSAIWIQRSNPKDEELRQRFDMSDDEIQAARGLLVAVDSPDQQVTVDVQAALERLRTLATRLKRTNVQRGDVVVARRAQFPVLRAMREAAESVSLEVFDKVDVKVDVR